MIDAAMLERITKQTGGDALSVAQAIWREAQLEAKQAPGVWQPTETAPRGGGAEYTSDPEWVEPPSILLLFPDGSEVVCKYDWYYDEDGAGAEQTDGCGWIEATLLDPVYQQVGRPIGWMLLPAAPKVNP